MNKEKIQNPNQNQTKLDGDTLEKDLQENSVASLKTESQEEYKDESTIERVERGAKEVEQEHKDSRLLLDTIRDIENKHDKEKNPYLFKKLDEGKKEINNEAHILIRHISHLKDFSTGLDEEKDGNNQIIDIIKERKRTRGEK